MGKALKNFLLVLASQIPAIGIAVAWWAEVIKNPIVAAGLAVGYEVGILFWKQLGKPVWEEVWEQDLKKQTVKKLAEWVKVTALNLRDFRRAYLQQVIYDHRVFPVRGLLTPGQGALEVEQVFVELQIAPSHAMQVSANPLTVKKLSGSQPVWTFLRRLHKKDATALAILGPPGCGKTTLLKHIALILAMQRHRRHKVKAALPIFLALREHVKLIVADKLPLAEIAQRYFADPTRYQDFNPPPYWFARQLKTGRCLMLLDGLDEVVDTVQRQAIAEWVDQQIRTYPRCRFVLTARPQGYRDNPLSRAQVLEVLNFNDEQVKRFIQNWYLAKKFLDYGKDDKGVRQDAAREAQDLLTRLNERPHLQALTVNPLLLTMIANIHNYRGKLPERRVDLYDEICNVLLGHWQGAKGVTEQLNAKQKLVVLRPLAAAMMTQKTRDLPTSKALMILKPPLLQVGVAEPDVPKFLAEAGQTTCGLLVEKEAGVWSFAHFTFQEYLCAAHWKETGEAADWDNARWQALIAENWWHETLRLYAAQADANVLVQTCLTLKTTPALRLAGEIAPESLTLAPALRHDVTDALQAVTIIRLRSEPLTVSEQDFRKVFKLNDKRRPLEYIQNEYEDLGEVVRDHATGLMWQKAGSDERLTYDHAQEYIDKLNAQEFAGHHDWRLPTIPELMSLLEPEKQANNLYINPIFDVTQRWCWSVDRLPADEARSAGPAWIVGFYYGSMGWGSLYNQGYVRGVRAGQ